MARYDEIGTRMKTFYEQIPQTTLMRRCPVIIRCDGKAFHTFTKDFEKPFDRLLVTAMQETMRYLCQNIQGCVLGYTQSDEISLVLVDYKKLTSSAWFDYEVQKMCSVVASMATMAFNKAFCDSYYKWSKDIYVVEDEEPAVYEKILSLRDAYHKAFGKAMFDARCFNIPREEVTNYVYWRQIDAIRNSIQMLGQANFSHKELQNKSSDDIKNMLLIEKDINWDELDVDLQRGSCCIKEIGGPHKMVWAIDREIPIFKGNGRAYIEDLIEFPD